MSTITIRYVNHYDKIYQPLRPDMSTITTRYINHYDQIYQPLRADISTITTRYINHYDKIYQPLRPDISTITTRYINHYDQIYQPLRQDMSTITVHVVFISDLYLFLVDNPNVNELLILFLQGLLELHRPIQMIPITTNSASSNPVNGEVYSIYLYVVKFGSVLLQACVSVKSLIIHNPLIIYCLNSNSQQFHQYPQNEQPSITSNH